MEDICIFPLMGRGQLKAKPWQSKRSSRLKKRNTVQNQQQEKESMYFHLFLEKLRLVEASHFSIDTEIGTFVDTRQKSNPGKET